jgi:hypothetical protein
MFLILSAVAAPVNAASSNPPGSPGGSGRLGGDQAGFEKRFGKNTGQSELVHGLEYTINGYGLVSVQFRSNVAVSVTIIADRLAHKPLSEADAADWIGTKADVAVEMFLPKDVKTNRKRLDTGDGRHEVACSSKAIAAAFDKQAWSKLKLSGSPGECHYIISPDTDGNAYQIEIALGHAGSLDRPQPTPTPSPTPTDDEIKASYPPLPDVRELAIRPGGMYGDKISFSGSILSIHVARPGYVLVVGDDNSKGYDAVLQVTVAAPDGSTEVIAVGYDGDTTGMFEGSWVTVYGTVVDTFTGTNAFGGSFTQPLIAARFVDLA